MKTSLGNFPRKTIATKVKITAQSLILTLKNFVFNCKNYRQIKDCALGTICAPPYINIFMDHFERKYTSPFLQGLSVIYLRFIDVIFFVWKGSKEQPICNLDELNTKHDSIKFEYKILKASISFLDTEVYIKNNKLNTKIYTKQNNRPRLLHIDPEHPKSLRCSVPYSQALQIQRICAASKDFERHCSKLKNWFPEQGYNSELLAWYIKTVEKLDKDKLIKGNKKDTTINTRIQLAIIFNRFLPNISKIIQTNWNILSANELLKKIFKTSQLQLSKSTKSSRMSLAVTKLRATFKRE